MKILKTIAAVCFCLLAAIACEPKIDETLEAFLEIKYAPDVATFQSKESRTYMVVSGNVKGIEVDSPKGWKVSCTTSALTVTAPDQNAEDIEIEETVVIRYSDAAGKVSSASLAVKLIVDIRPVLSFVLDCKNISISSAVISCTPSGVEGVPYFCNIIDEATLDKYEGNVADFCAGQLEAMQERYPTLSLPDILAGMVDTEPIVEERVKNLPAGTGLVLFAITADAETGEAYGEPAIFRFETLPPGDSEDCIFSFEINKLSSHYISYNVIASDGSVRYWSALDEVERWPDAGTEEENDIAMTRRVKGWFEEVVESEGISMSDLVNTICSRGDITDSDPELTPGKAYYMYAYAIDEQGNPAGPMFKERFETPLTDLSDADMTIEYKYFDASEAAAAHPDVRKYADYAAAGLHLLQVKSVPNPYTYVWTVGVVKGDFTDVDKYPDTQTYNAVAQSGIAGKEITEFGIPMSDGQCTILNFAVDADSVFGPLHRTLVSLNAEGVSPVSEMFESSGGDVEPPVETTQESSVKTGLDVISRRLEKMSDSPEHFRRRYIR